MIAPKNPRGDLSYFFSMFQKTGIGLITSALPAFRGAFAGRDHGFGRCLDLGHVVVALGREPDGVVAELDRRILGRTFRGLTARQAIDHRVVVGIEEEGNGVTQGSRDVAHAVWRREKTLVG